LYLQIGRRDRDVVIVAVAVADKVVAVLILTLLLLLTHIHQSCDGGGLYSLIICEISKTQEIQKQSNKQS